MGVNKFVRNQECVILCHLLVELLQRLVLWDVWHSTQFQSCVRRCEPDWSLRFDHITSLMVNTLECTLAEEKAITVEYGNGRSGRLWGAHWQWAQPLAMPPDGGALLVTSLFRVMPGTQSLGFLGAVLALSQQRSRTKPSGRECQIACCTVKN